MKYIIIILLIVLTSCNRCILTTDLNAIGVVTHVKKTKETIDGIYIYTVSITPYYEIKYRSFDIYTVGQEVYIQSTIIKDE